MIAALFSSVEVWHCSFSGSYNGSILILHHSNVSSYYSVYNNNTAAILVMENKSIAIFHSCLFQNNTAMYHTFVLSNASVLVIYDSLWEHNIFQKNTSSLREHEFMIVCITCITVVMQEHFY